MEKNLEGQYDHKKIEDRIYKLWENGGFFNSDINPSKIPFTIMMPPPNVTGYLHIGHALNHSLQDIAIRYKRMNNFEALWLPGVDHAGIATQAVVERELQKEGTSRHILGREKFLEKVWEWKNKYGNIIVNQLKKLGVSADWRKLRFTLDDSYSKAVREAFVSYYEKGLIYKGNRIISWCPSCHTALSDIEVEHHEKEAKLYYVRYYFEDNSGYIVVATTRPETILADTAVAVNPEDERYKNLIGKTAIVPIVSRQVKIIGDTAVDKEFGTGALKVTPGHDPVDFEIGERHNLLKITVINFEGYMNENALHYKELEVSKARGKFVEELKEKGFIEKIEDYKHSVGFCSRCGTAVEPLISSQWFLKMKELAEPAMKVVEEKRVELVPEKWIKVYLSWLSDIEDWCISRQLWWGHRIPIWYCEDCPEVIVSREDPKECPKCKSSKLKQDEDVLDTWFSSALWPFATLGWPDKTKELEYYYPTSLLLTGYDIIFFWVARMIFSGLEFMKDIPFETVYITGLVRDEYGRKMSKSLKNIVDPLELIDKYGTDALRFTLAHLSTYGGQDINLSDEKLTSSKHFINKIWNASKFVLTNLEGFDFDNIKVDEKLLSSIDKWILAKLDKTIKLTREKLDIYDFGDASKILYSFVWGNFCDWYIEASKPYLKSSNEKIIFKTKSVLAYLLINILKLLHPFIPFITEEIYQIIYSGKKALIKDNYPEPSNFAYNIDEEKTEEFFDTIKTIRNLKAIFKLPPSLKIDMFFKGNNEKIAFIKENEEILKFLGRVNEILESKPAKFIKGALSDLEIYILTPQDIDINEEIIKLKVSVERLEKEEKQIKDILSNEDFLKKAPDEVTEKYRKKLEDLLSEKNIIVNFLKNY